MTAADCLWTATDQLLHGKCNCEASFKQLFPATATPSKLLVGKVAIKLKSRMTGVVTPVDDLTKLVIKFGVSGSSYPPLHRKLRWLHCSHLAVFYYWSRAAQDGHKYRSHLFTPEWECCRYLFGEEEFVLECSHSAPTGSVCHHDRP